MTSEVLNNFCFKKDKESRKQRTNNTINNYNLTDR